MCSSDKELLLDLLVMQSTEAISDKENSELQRLIKEYPEYKNYEFDEIASLAHMSYHLDDNRSHVLMPSELKSKILNSHKRIDSLSLYRLKINAFMRSLFDQPTYAWAITALLVMGISFSMIEFKNYNSDFRYLPLERVLLQSTSNDLVEYPWYSKKSDFAMTKGDIVWSNKSQKGFIKISGMPVNDPSKNQYQIWIIDPLKYKQPVDGGVFNVNVTDQDIIIPINPKLPILNAKGFAITLEQPGGVVVSSQELILTAPEIRPSSTFTL
tara:strand:+ start:2406 stop:3212 length:807 start_codon:yes stop_codon:yes gene_type:complete